MVDLQATAQPAAQQQLTIFFGGQMDQVMMGAPVYFWCIFATGMLCVVMGFLILYYRLYILDKVWAFVDCYKKRMPLALIRNSNRQAYFKPLQYMAQVFSTDDSPDRWMTSALESSQSIAGVPLLDACDYYDWLQDPIKNQAILEIVSAWNDGMLDETVDQDPEHLTYLKGKAPHPDIEKIYSYTDFQRVLSSGKLKDYFDSTEIVYYKKGSVKVAAHFIIDVSKVEQYLPKTRGSALMGGYTTWLAELAGGKQEKDTKTMAMYFIAGCTAIIVCGIIAGLLSGAIG
jgi:hypothetical protein